MSLLWRSAVIDGDDFGEPSEEYVRQTKHEYLRKHYDDIDWNHPTVVADKSIHDHFDHQGQQYQARPHENGCASSAEDCQHGPTVRRIKEIAQQNWDISHQQLLAPEKHQQRRDRQRAELSGFLSDYALDHPDRVHSWNSDGSIGESDDPRLKGV